jgi:hypothetical protein
MATACLVLVCADGFGLVSAARADEGGASVAQKPDFSNVKSRDEVERLAAEGRLQKAFLFPIELGGQDVEQNVVYLPPEAVEAQRLIVGTLTRFAHDGLIDKLNVEPQFRGESLVPSRIIYHASHSQKPGGIEPTIEIW